LVLATMAGFSFHSISTYTTGLFIEPLSKEFGWTPTECAELTIGQVLLYLEMIARGEHPEEGRA